MVEKIMETLAKDIIWETVVKKRCDDDCDNSGKKGGYGKKGVYEDVREDGESRKKGEYGKKEGYDGKDDIGTDVGSEYGD